VVTLRLGAVQGEASEEVRCALFHLLVMVVDVGEAFAVENGRKIRAMVCHTL
jgi:hypothetical protein